MAHGGPCGIPAQSPRLYSSGLYWSGMEKAACTRGAGPCVPRPMAWCSERRSRPPSFQSRRSVTTTVDMLTPPCTSAQSFARNDTAVATCRMPRA